ncbi:HAD family hydrolase [Paraurantiacibacter namhicola]|uniref:Alpha-D-glucose-1-phosphatase n=1 Tax=Paraurantiacibacter namhicola TaxID=645517 RepID=A0A1C7D4M5_9SPHN|nr:HAD family phosphatase [Paraurantiacibacter namhicola]ANU06408.1 Alpha-D-glucose-1-phosphatase [Paraurantiacibacter namhicola]
MTKAVVFDVGRVLIQWDLRCLFAKLIADEAELDWFLTHVVTEQWHFQTDAGRPVAEIVAERKAEFPQHAALIQAYRDRFLETVPGPVPGTAALVDRLAAIGVPLFALTNFGSEFWPQFRPTCPPLRHMRDVVVSGDERLAKPDPRIYALAEERFGRVGDALFFTDDNPDNIAAAKARGWDAVLFEDAAQLERELQARGLL